jgi:hypothetical protein
MRTRSVLLIATVMAGLVGPIAAGANHTPRHDNRPNPNCAWDSKRSADYDGDGEPDHMVVGVGHNTTFPRQVVVLTEPYTGMDHVPPFFGSNDGPDDVSVVIQGDHRMLGANPATDETGESDDPEQKHNGAIYAHVDYDDVEHGRAPRADFGAGIYEANHLVMVCGSTDGDPTAAACLAGNEFFLHNHDECPED